MLSLRTVSILEIPSQFNHNGFLMEGDMWLRYIERWWYRANPKKRRGRKNNDSGIVVCIDLMFKSSHESAWRDLWRKLILSWVCVLELSPIYDSLLAVVSSDANRHITVTRTRLTDKWKQTRKSSACAKIRARCQWLASTGTFWSTCKETSQ